MKVVIKTVATGIACGCSNYEPKENRATVLALKMIHGAA